MSSQNPKLSEETIQFLEFEDTADYLRVEADRILHEKLKWHDRRKGKLWKHERLESLVGEAAQFIINASGSSFDANQWDDKTLEVAIDSVARHLRFETDSEPPEVIRHEFERTPQGTYINPDSVFDEEDKKFAGIVVQEALASVFSQRMAIVSTEEGKEKFKQYVRDKGRPILNSDYIEETLARLDRLDHLDESFFEPGIISHANLQEVCTGSDEYMESRGDIAFNRLESLLHEALQQCGTPRTEREGISTSREPSKEMRERLFKETMEKLSTKEWEGERGVTFGERLKKMIEDKASQNPPPKVSQGKKGRTFMERLKEKNEKSSKKPSGRED